MTTTELVSQAWGRVVTDGDVSNAVEASLRFWLPSALAELARRKGLGPGDVDLPVDESWWRMATGDDLSRDAGLPAVVVAAGGSELTRRPSTHDGSWPVTVTCAVRHDDHRDTYDLAALYVSGVELALAQDPGLRAGTGEPFSTDVWLSGHRVEPLDPEATRTVLLGVVDLTVTVSDVLARRAGPPIPPPLPDVPEDPQAPGPWQPPVTGPPLDDVRVSVRRRDPEET